MVAFNLIVLLSSNSKHSVLELYRSNLLKKNQKLRYTLVNLKNTVCIYVLKDDLINQNKSKHISKI